jgi:competence protein ComEC
MAIGLELARCGLAPARGALAAAAAALLVGAGATAASRLTLAGGALLVAVAALGALRLAPVPLPADHVARLELPAAAVLEGRLAEEPVRWAPDRARILLEVEAIHREGERRPAQGRVQLALYGEGELPGEGQPIQIEARLWRPVGFRNPGGFDHTAHLRDAGILVTGSAALTSMVPLAPDAPPWPARVRRWSVATLARHLPETSAALLAGLLVGERSALPPAVDEAFRRAGVYHILAVSGFNVALVAASTFAALSLAGVPLRGAALAAMAAVGAFALVAGPQASVVRATLMCWLLLGGLVLDRESHVGNALGLAALLLLAWRPADLWDAGFQLSFAATAGIVHLAPPVTAALEERGWRPWLAQSLAVSLAAQAAVVPFMLAHFNQLSLIGVVANLAVVPLAALATPLGLLALVTAALWDAAGGALLHATWVVLLALRAVIWAAASLAWSIVHVPAPPVLASAAWLGALALLPLAGARPPLRLVAGLLLATATAGAAWPWARAVHDTLRVTFLDVGQGDATLIELPTGKRLLIDGGPAGARRLDVGERVIAPVLWNRGIFRLDAVALTHADPDHSGGLAAIVRRFRVGELWETGRWTEAGEPVLRALAERGVPRRVLAAGHRLWVGDALVTVLHPGGEPLPGENDNSLVLRVDWRGVSLLLPGDAGHPAEARLLEAGAARPVFALKLGHHGSRFSTAPEFLAALHPAIAVASAGPRNRFNHPAPEILTRLYQSGIRVYRTDHDGAVVLETDGTTATITRWVTGKVDHFTLITQTGDAQ